MLLITSFHFLYQFFVSRSLKILAGYFVQINALGGNSSALHGQELTLRVLVFSGYSDIAVLLHCFVLL